ncbi:MAG: glycine cleavage system aminomethyltransferase GcvT [Clostridiales bacterium]|nr:glycine cleavage system aminomethyltransferase GcvT [Clostridiales bacterium]
MEQKTPLYGVHVKSGVKMVPFAGYLLPIQYGTGLIAEHMAVRTACGLFDVSHMGEFLCRGPDALVNLNRLMTNDFTGMYEGQARYSPMCNEQGGIVDDLIVYRMPAGSYLIVVNAANQEKDLAWMQAHLRGDATLEDVSGQVAQIALQGPRALEILQKIAPPQAIPAKYYSCVPKASIQGMDCIVSKTGYTGENGFEIYTKPEDATAIWDLCMAAGQDLGLIPCGLGARDTLRLEAAMPLYGHEMDDTTTPLECGLDFALKLQKPDFIGKEAILAQRPPRRRRVGLRVTGRGIVREGAPLYIGAAQVGAVTSGTYAPYLKAAVAMAMVDSKHCEIATAMEAEVRGRRIAAEVVPLPFYKRERNKS